MTIDIPGPAPATSQCPLSIVIGTTQPRPELALPLDSVHDQAVQTGAQLLVADGTIDGSGLPASILSRYPQVTPLYLPGASIFQLRAHAIAHARGEIVAITEDHCRLAPDWCRQILAAHRRRPRAAAIGGAVENGARASTLDWVLLFVANGQSYPPVPHGEQRKIALQAAATYKRTVLPTSFPACGYMEWQLNEQLHTGGQQLVSDGSIRVAHAQSFLLL